MSNLLYAEPELVIALSNRLIFVNPNDLQIFKEVALPDDLAELGLKDTNVNNEREQDDKTKQQSLRKEPPTIQHVKMSHDRQILAVSTSGQKSLLLYTLRPEHATLLSIRSIARASSALTFNADSTRLLVTDKTGDCYEYDCVEYEAVPKLLFGHLSIVYDVLWSNDGNFIITCDRDDKIRVTNYPATYDIHSYCLGHKEFVAGLKLLHDDVLLSVSGDKTMKLWDFKEGRELMSVTLPAPGIKFSTRSLSEGKYDIAVMLHQPNECVATYLLSHDANKEWTFRTRQLLNFNDIICCNLCYAQDRLFVTGVKDDRFVIKLAANCPAAPINWTDMIEEQFKMYSWKPEDISGWFKKKYDNVSEYMERKKRRIEGKLK